MKKLFLILAATLAMVSPKAAQAIDVEGAYVGGIAGLNWLHYHHDGIDARYKVGWLGGLNLGYRWCNGLRAEVEAVYRYNKIKRVNGHSRGGHTHTWSFMANGLYEIDYFCWCITPYVGAGIGYDTTRSKACGSHHKNGFAWQVIAGGLYPIDDCLEMGLEYRFHHGRAKNVWAQSVDLRLNWFF